MIKYKCKTCQGTYSDKCADGLEYYHACPPERIDDFNYKERENKRDENTGKKLEGKGRDKIE